MGIWDDFFSKAKSLFGNETDKKSTCYYELLGVSRDATEDDIKRAYKKMALKWHPDKNPDRLEECTAYFVVLQQAYEVLSNPHERAFYDRHRENIIYGGDGPEDKKDMGINLAPYFERSCFHGFGDDEKGFYHVYRDLFHKISAEEYLYIEEMDDRNFPVFGNSQSTYEMFVDPFYSFWMDFSTHRSFAWLDTNNLREAQDRPTIRAMEKENKKLRDAGKSQRSDEIQRLVMHIRKLDPRVKAYRKQLAERNKEQLKRVEEHRLQTIRRNLEDLEDYEEDEEAKREHMRRLEEIENQLDAEFGTLGVKKPTNAGNDDNLDENEDDEDDSYCVVCEKHFKTSKSYANHVKSKKHKQGVELLRKHMREEDQAILIELEREQEKAENENGAKRHAKKKGKCQDEKPAEEFAEPNVDDSSRLNEEISELQGTVSSTLILSEENDTNTSENCETASGIPSDDPKDKGKTKKKARRAVAASGSKKLTKVEVLKEENMQKSTEPVRSLCETCGEEFESRSKLFNHLRDSGHAAIKAVNDSIMKSSKKRGGKKLK